MYSPERNCKKTKHEVSQGMKLSGEYSSNQKSVENIQKSCPTERSCTIMCENIKGGNYFRTEISYPLQNGSSKSIIHIQRASRFNYWRNGTEYEAVAED
jgi:hypothetical protein